MNVVIFFLNVSSGQCHEIARGSNVAASNDIIRVSKKKKKDSQIAAAKMLMCSFYSNVLLLVPS